MMQNFIFLTLFIASAIGAPSISRLESIDVERRSLNTIESDSNDRSMEVINKQDELISVLSSSSSSSPSPLSSSLPSLSAKSKTTESKSSTFLPFHSMMERLSGGHGDQTKIPVIPRFIPLNVVNSDLVQKRIIYTSPQMSDINSEMKAE